MTAAFVDQPNVPGEHPVEYFWRLLAQLPAHAYPAGVVPVGEHYPGTSGFSAGAGLYRIPGDPMPRFPVGGIMFVAHNLDSEKNYLDWIHRQEDPGQKMRYWRMLFKLLERAEIDRSRCFWTNYFVGLKEGDQATGAFPGAQDSSFCRWCDHFLDAQIRIMKPSVVVTFGGAATSRMSWPKTTQVRERAGVRFAALSLRHPSAAISRERQAIEAQALLGAYEHG